LTLVGNSNLNWDLTLGFLEVGDVGDEAVDLLLGKIGPSSDRTGIFDCDGHQSVLKQGIGPPQ
jgi:hypothetical protein